MFFKELFSVFKSARPIDSASKDFARMLALAQEMVLEASAVYWGRAYSARERTALYKKDVDYDAQIEKRAEALVELGHFVLERTEAIVVHIPSALVDLDEADIVLDETAREETGAPELALTVFLPDVGRFLRNIEGFQIFRSHEFDRVVVENTELSYAVGERYEVVPVNAFPFGDDRTPLIDGRGQRMVVVVFE